MGVVVRKEETNIAVTKVDSTVQINKNTVPGQFTNFTAAGDTGSSQINDGDTLTISGGTGIDTSSSNDTITVAVDNTIATKTYVDTQVGTVNTLEELTDTNTSNPVDGALLQYDTASSKWVDSNEISGGIFI